MAFTKITASGIGSTETVTLDGLSVINDGSFGGNVSVGGTLTYEDVTNIDSVGLITARNGIVVGSGITLSVDGDGFFTGVVTATSYAGDGSALTGISVDSTQIVTGNTSVQTVDTGSDGHVKVNTEGSERVRITNAGDFGIGTDSPAQILHVNKSSGDAYIRVQGGTNQGTLIHKTDGTLIGGFLSGGGVGGGTDDIAMRVESGNNMLFAHGTSERLRIDSSGHVLPATNDTYDLGSSSKRWRDIYTGDLNLSNEGKSNDVDGTWGNYTIQEGENDLFLINNRSGKKYKFNLTEVS